MIDVFGYDAEIDIKKVKEYAEEYYNSDWDHTYEFNDVAFSDVCENITDARWFHSRIKGFVRYFIEREWDGSYYLSFTGYQLLNDNLQELCEAGLFL